MAEHSGTKSFLGNLASNAVWEWIKAIGGGLLSSFITAFTQYIRHRPMDWWGLLALAIITTVVIGLILNRERSTKTTTDSPPSHAPQSPPAVLPSENGLEADQWRRERAQLESDLWRAQESARLCGEEKRAAIEQLEETKQRSTLLSSLQWDALILAKDLRDFQASLGPYPAPPNPEANNADELFKSIWERAENQGAWGRKLMHGYANRGFGPKITSLMHRAGEEHGYPAYLPNYAETITVATKDTLPKLAQQMEMIAIWINRKQRNEVDLLHEA